MKVALALIGVTALARVALADDPPVPVVERDVVELAPARGVRITSIDVDNRLGDVRVEGHDRDSISVMAIKRAPDGETIERLKVSLVPDPNGPVTISTSLLAGQEARPVPAGAIRIDLVILAPRGARVQAEAWKGKVAIQGLDNGAELVTDDGDIDVTQVSGDISTRSAHGSQSFAEIFGAIDARAVQGDLDLDLVRGERLAAMVQLGDVIAHRVRVRNLSVRITRGDAIIEGEAMPGGSYHIASYWGNVQVKLRGKTPVRVAARTQAGQVTLPARLRRRENRAFGDSERVIGSLGSGRSPADLDLRTRVGSITVTEF
ncbi:MAG TPA: DUF4097 family beta strand repeat-containing protein [Kofleriaceae bacterium]|nr:DUF4097 family beta strand repeat-containing protein [Kofleriaceae bacterium]